MLVEQQIAERQERALDAVAKILERPGGGPYGDYQMRSASGKTYRVAMRGPGLFENYCSCPDFAVNTLGTCKHIEALLLRLRKRHGHKLESKAFARSRASISLQAASAVINFEPPWNPARLEQRIGRVHRMGQAHPVHVVHLLTKDSIEERVWETLKLKKSLFAGVFDSPTGEVSFAVLGKKSVLQAVKEIFADQPGRPKPIVETAAPKPVPVRSVSASAASQPAAFEQAAAGLVETGVRFLESLAAMAQSASAAEGLASLVSHDPRTNRPVLSIPLPQSMDGGRLVQALAAFVSAFGRSV